MAVLQAQMWRKNTDFEPILSRETIDYHYGKHHAGYAAALNSLIEGTKFASQSLEEIIIQSRNSEPKIFNNAAQLFNHDFYWQCLKLSREKPTGKLKSIVERQFGSCDEFLTQYASFAGAMFGSGWCWLICENDELSFLNTQNAETPVGMGKDIICVIDLWEHAYYVDYRNDRGSYINKIVEECINWDFCGERLSSCAD